MADARTLWIDASNGVAGDMLLGALVDAGAPLGEIQAAVDQVIPGAVQLRAESVRRGGMRATKIHVDVLVADQPHRDWTTIRGMLHAANLAEATRTAALATFERVAVAEARAHGTSPEQVHFHEVGALDSIADTVGVCEAVRLLGITEVVGSAVALGSGHVQVAHGRIPVPVPAVLELAIGWPTLSGEDADAGHSPDHPHSHAHSHDHAHDQPDQGHTATHSQGPAGALGELATPTGMALVRALAHSPGPIPQLTTEAVGIGAGTRELPHRPNVVRVVIGTRAATPHQAASAPGRSALVHELECNVDDLDPRLWPGVLDALLAAGALDAWLAPIIMKHGRPAHTLHALAGEEVADVVGKTMLEHTTTLGVRRHQPLHRVTWERMWVDVALEAGPLRGRTVPVKVAHDGVVIRNVAPEFANVAALASEFGVSALDVLELAKAAAAVAGLVRGAPVPPAS